MIRVSVNVNAYVGGRGHDHMKRRWVYVNVDRVVRDGLADVRV